MIYFLVDRLPEYFPIADCREGYNTGFTAVQDDSGVYSVKIQGIYILQCEI